MKDGGEPLSPRISRVAAWPVLLLVFLAALLPLLSTPVLPFIDLYNHLARYFVLAHIDASPLLQANYEARWALLPNIGLDVIGTAMLTVVPQAWAAHAIVIAIFAVQFGGVLYLNRALTGRVSWLVAVLTVPLLYSWILNWGFANFLFGLGLAFAAAGWWVSQRARPWLAEPVAVVLGVLIFFTHGVAFGLYGLLAGALEIGFWLEHRRIALLARQLGLLALQAVLPLWLFTLAKTNEAPGGITNADESIARLRAVGGLLDRLWELVCYRVETIVRVAEGPGFAFDAVMLAATLALLALLARRGVLRLVRPMWPVLALGVVLVICMPPALFGVGYVADRIPLFVALAFVAGLQVRKSAPRPLVLGIGLLVAVRLVVIALAWQAYARDEGEFERIAALIPPGSLVNDVIVGGIRHDDAPPRCPMYRPQLISLHGQVGPLFANETQQPLRLIGPLKAALDRMPKGVASRGLYPGFYDDFIAAAGPAGFDYLLICNAGLLTRPFPAGSSVVARGARFVLLRVG